MKIFSNTSKIRDCRAVWGTIQSIWEVAVSYNTLWQWWNKGFSLLNVKCWIGSREVRKWTDHMVEWKTSKFRDIL